VSVSALARLQGDLPETDGAGEQLRHLEQGLGKVKVGVVVLGPPQGQLQRLRREADYFEHAVQRAAQQAASVDLKNHVTLVQSGPGRRTVLLHKVHLELHKN